MKRPAHRWLSFNQGYSSVKETIVFAPERWVSKHAAALRGAVGQTSLRVRDSGISLSSRVAKIPLVWLAKSIVFVRTALSCAPHDPVAAQIAQFYPRVTVLYTKPMVFDPECLVFQAFCSPERCYVQKSHPGKVL